MGGHGGLNILPQKKWNVYNRDNREKVEKDKRLAEEKKLNNEKKVSKSQAEARYDKLKYDKKTEEKSKSSLLTQELLDISSNKHLNFFEDAEKIISSEANNTARIDKEIKITADLPYDQSSKFMGTLNDKKNIPWYIQNQENEKKEKFDKLSEKELNYYKTLKEFQTDSQNYYKVIDKQMLFNSENNENSKDKKKEIKKEKKKEKKKNKKIKKEKKHKNKKIEIEDKVELLKKLREERLKREEMEKIKEKELLRKQELFNNF